MRNLDPKPGFFLTLETLPAGTFTTADFLNQYRKQYPTEWSELESEYGAGGKGAGQYHTVFTRIAKWLSRTANKDIIQKLPHYVPAPYWWGNSVIQAWSKGTGKHTQITPDSVDEEFREGTLILKKHLLRERAWRLAKSKKASFVSEHGRLFCERCQMDPVEIYGTPLAIAMIEVHHAAIAVGRMKDGHRTKLADLQCLCANCHRLVHAEMA